MCPEGKSHGQSSYDKHAYVHTHTFTKGLKETFEGDNMFLSPIVIVAGKEIKPVNPKGYQP